MVKYMLGNNRKNIPKCSIMHLDLANIDGIKIKNILCIGNTGSDGSLRIYFRESSKSKRFSCNPSKTSVFLVKGKILQQENLEPQEPTNNYKKLDHNILEKSVYIYILVEKKYIDFFMKDIYYKALKRQGEVFTDLHRYASCLFARHTKIKNFSEYESFKGLENPLLSNAKYISYNLEEKNLVIEKAYQNYTIFTAAASKAYGIEIHRTKCIGNTEFDNNQLRIYITQNQREDFFPVPHGTSLFALRCKLRSEIVRQNLIFNEFSRVFKSSSIFPSNDDSLTFTAFLLVFADKLQIFLHNIHSKKKPYICPYNLSSYGQVVLASMLKSNTPLLTMYTLQEIKVLNKLGILQSVTIPEFILLDKSVSKDQICPKQKVANNSLFGSMMKERQEEVVEEAEEAVSGNDSMFSKFRRSVSTLLSRQSFNNFGYREIN